MAANVGLDLTTRLVAEARWRDAEHKFSRLCAASPDAIISGDAHAKVMFWNAAAEAMFGYGQEEILGRPWAALLPPEERERFADRERWMRRSTRQFTGLRRDGSRFPAEVSLAHWRASGQDFQTCFVRDLTERRAVESQLEQARRIESLGHVAATVAHELNNVLMGIGTFNSVISKAAREDGRVQSATRSIERATGRARAIVEGILHYSRGNEPLLQVVDLAKWLATIADELRAVSREHVSLTVAVPADEVPVSCDVHQIAQVLVNLVRNACEAIEDTGAVSVTLEVRDYCADAILRDGERCARVTVADTGAGMSEETLRRIFEPLFTTKSTGTGIGLALARRLIEKHGGLLTATSEAGRGSTFVIHLPLLQ